MSFSEAASAPKRFDAEPGFALSPPLADERAESGWRPRRDFKTLLYLYIPGDMIALLAGFVCAWAVAASVNSIFVGRDDLHAWLGHNDGRLTNFLMAAAGAMLWFYHTSHYRMRMPFWLEVKKIVGTLGVAMMADGFLQFTSKLDLSRLWLISGWVFAAAAIVAFRSLLRAFLRFKGKWQVPTLLVGDGAMAEDARAALKSEPSLGYDVTAQIKNLPAAFTKYGKSWERLCAVYGADYVVIALDGKDLAAAEQPMAQLMREFVPFSVSPPLRHLPVLGMTPQYFFNHDIMLLTRSSGLEQPLPRFVKRGFDILVSVSALLLASPLLLAIALLVKLDGGPAWFRHARIGLGGRIFYCFKFRSMVTDGDAVLQQYLARNPLALAEWQATRKLRNDPRITRIGTFLRLSSLDELPQLLNVLKGDMSLVGPRPIVTAELASYDSDIAHYYRVRPGITGLWQVSGRNDVSYPRRVQMDSWYVRNWSLWHDIAILCKTFPAVLKRSGAY